MGNDGAFFGCFFFFLANMTKTFIQTLDLSRYQQKETCRRPVYGKVNATKACPDAGSLGDW